MSATTRSSRSSKTVRLPAIWGGVVGFIGTVGVLAATVLAAGPATAAATNPGDVDASFGVAGTVQTSFVRNGAATAAWIKDTVVQADGRIIAVGTSLDIDRSFSTFAVARYLGNGTLDQSFSGDGMVQIGFGDERATAYGVSLTVDGKVVIVGESASTDLADLTDQTIAIARLESDGDLDPTFSGDGRVVTDLGAFDNYAHGVKVQANGKIVVVGSKVTDGNGTPAMMLLRYTSGGALDASFSGDGKLAVAAADRSYGEDLALQADGSVVAVGMDLARNPSEFLVARATSAGVLDPGFSADGLKTIGFGGVGGVARRVALASNGSIVVLGQMLLAQENHFALARLSSAGALDVSFSGDGKLTTQFAGLSSTPGGLAIESSGRIVATGYANTGLAQAIAAARFASNGSPDISFGAMGQTTFQIEGLTSSATSISVAADGNLLVSGQVVRNGVTGFSLTKLLSGIGIPPAVGAAGGGGAAGAAGGAGAGAAGGGSGAAGQAGSGAATPDAGANQATSANVGSQVRPGAPSVTGVAAANDRLTFNWQAGAGGDVTTYSYRSQGLRKRGSGTTGWTGWTSVGADTTSVTVAQGRRLAGHRLQLTATNAAGASASSVASWKLNQTGNNRGCRRVVVTGATYLSNGQGLFSFARPAQHCAKWQLNGSPARRLARQSTSLLAPALVAGREHRVLFRSGRARTTLSLRRG